MNNASSVAVESAAWTTCPCGADPDVHATVSASRGSSTVFLTSSLPASCLCLPWPCPQATHPWPQRRFRCHPDGRWGLRHVDLTHCTAQFQELPEPRFSIFHNPQTVKNLVLIGGLNGYGKTTLLEAVYVGLYGEEAVNHKALDRSALKAKGYGHFFEKPRSTSYQLRR